MIAVNELTKEQRDVVQLVARRVSPTGDLRGVIAFGSLVRDGSQVPNDIDLVCVISGSRSGDFAPYQHIRANGIPVDLNIATIQELTALSTHPAWQYRLCEAQLITGLQRDVSAIETWLRRLQSWIRTHEARLHRIDTLRSEIKKILSCFFEPVSIPDGFRIHAVAECICAGLFLNHELAAELPFLRGDPLSLSHLQLVRQLDAVWPLPRRRRTPDSKHNTWAEFKHLLAKTRNVIRRRCPGIWLHDEQLLQYAIKSEDANMARALAAEYRMSGWSTGNGWRCLETIKRLTLSAGRETSLPSAKISDLFPRRARRHKRGSGPRLSSWDPKRRRLKIIVPTGGCRVRTCTFCGLPNLAQDDPNLSSVVTDWDHIEDVFEVAIYTDGSFFDEEELSACQRRELLSSVTKLEAKRLLVESLPRFVTKVKLTPVLDMCGRCCELTIGVGIQTTNVAYRTSVLSTPITDAEIENLFNLREQLEFSLRIYLLYGKPLFTTEEDIVDVRSSVAALAPRLRRNDVITINRLLCSHGTATERLQQMELWSEVDMCRMRRLISELSQAYTNLNIRPGCIGVTSCTADEVRSYGCETCLSWLLAAEQGTAAVPAPCSALPSEKVDLPWPVFGEYEHRCAFVGRVIGSLSAESA